MEDVVRFYREVRHRLKDYDDPDLPFFVREYRTTHALLVDRDGAAAARFQKEAYPEGWEEDPIRLNAFAWWCFENGVNLEEAEVLALKAVDLCEPGETAANIMDTVAEIRNARGDPEDALAWIEKALLLNPNNEYLQGQKARFEGLRESP